MRIGIALNFLKLLCASSDVDQSPVLLELSCQLFAQGPFQFLGGLVELVGVGLLLGLDVDERPSREFGNFLRG